MELRSRSGTRRGRLGLALSVLLVGMATAAALAEPPKDRPGRQGGLTPATTPAIVRLDVNRVILTLVDNGSIASGSSVGSGGFWKATSDPYIFAGGPNVNAIIPSTGTIVHMEGGPFSQLDEGGPTFDAQGLDEWYDTQNPEDVGNFPSDCTVDAERAVAFPTLRSFQGQPFPGFADRTVCIAVNDIDGGTCADCAGTRLGAEIVEVWFAFSVPLVQDFVFFAWRIFNSTQFLNASNAPVQPAGPYDLQDAIVAVAFDPDIGEAGNDQIAFLPDVQTMVYWSALPEPTFANPLGFGGVTYLQTPIDPTTGLEVGLAEFTVFTNGQPRDDPTSKEEWRRLMLGDPDEVVLEVDPRDIRGMAASAPFPLPVGGHVDVFGAIFNAEASGGITPADIGLRAEAYKNLATGEIIPNANTNPIFDNFKNVQRTAQLVFDGGFLVPVAPSKPDIELVPGDHQITILWSDDAVVAPNAFAVLARDPFSRLEDNSPDPDAPGRGIFLEADDVIFSPEANDFVTAAQAGLTGREVTNPAYNPAFVINDFEGFKVFRSFSGLPGEEDRELIAQVDLANGIIDGEFCNAARPITDADDNFITAVCTERVFLDLGGQLGPVDVGGDTGLIFSIVDRGGSFPDPSTGPGLINGIPVTYDVVPYAVNPGLSPITLPPDQAATLDFPPAPLVLESSPIFSAAENSATPRSNASSFVEGVLGELNLVGSDGTVVTGNNVDLPLDAVTGIPTGPLPGARDFTAPVSLINPEGLPRDFGELVIHFDAASARLNCVDACGNYTNDVFGEDIFEGTGAFDRLPGVDTRGREVVWRITDAEGNVQRDAISGVETRGSAFTGFISFTGVSSFGTPIFSVQSPLIAEQDIAFTVQWTASIGNRSTMCPRAGNCVLLDESRAGLPASVANVDFEVGMYGQYHYGDIEVVWSNQGGVLTLASVRDLSNNVDIPFSADWGQEAWGFGAETGLGAPEDALADLAVAPRTASGKVLYPDPLFTWVGGQNSSFGAGIQGAAHWTDLPVDAAIFDKIATVPQFPDFVSDLTQPGAFQENAALFTCPAADGSFACAGDGAGKQGTRLWLVGIYLDLAFNELPADGETWIVQLPNGAPTTPRPPVPGQTIRFALLGATNNPEDANLSEITVVPNPFIAANEAQQGRGLQRILFTKLPPVATIRIYTISGNLIRVLEHTDGSGTEAWDVRTRFDMLTASGNYYFHVTTPDGRTHLGRFAVIN